MPYDGGELRSTLYLSGRLCADSGTGVCSLSMAQFFTDIMCSRCCSYAEEIRRQAAESLLEDMDATLSSPDKTSPRRRCASLQAHFAACTCCIPANIYS